VRKTGGATDGA